MVSQVRLSGSGGQGLILAGIILAEAGILDGLNVVQTQSYGPAARGGASKAEVILSNAEIDYPKVEVADVLLALNQESCHMFIGGLKPGGVAIIDSSMVQNIPSCNGRIYAVPITKLAREDIGRELVANIVALGVLVGLTGVVTADALIKAVLARVPRGTEELNTRALQLGFDLAQQAASKSTAKQII